MEKGLKALQKEWEFIRLCSTSFINELSDSDLDRELPRKGLNTFRKHFEEMFGVQRDYVTAISSGVMNFNGTPDSEIEGKLSKVELLHNMKLVDQSLISTLEDATQDGQVEWFGEKQLLPFHLSAMISHEAMHIGQIIAFCYVLDIAIPEFVERNWGLSGR